MKEVLKSIIEIKYEKVKNTLKFMQVVKQRVEEIINTNIFSIELYEDEDLIKTIEFLNELYSAINKDSLKK